MTHKKKISFYADEDLVQKLNEESDRTGAPVGELIRRAVQAFFYTLDGTNLMTIKAELLRHNECAKQLERVGIKVLVAEQKQ
jgi:hypothetical protein